MNTQQTNIDELTNPSSTTINTICSTANSSVSTETMVTTIGDKRRAKEKSKDDIKVQQLPQEMCISAIEIPAEQQQKTELDGDVYDDAAEEPLGEYELKNSLEKHEKNVDDLLESLLKTECGRGNVLKQHENELENDLKANGNEFENNLKANGNELENDLKANGNELGNDLQQNGNESEYDLIKHEFEPENDAAADTKMLDLAKTENLLAQDAAAIAVANSLLKIESQTAVVLSKTRIVSIHSKNAFCAVLQFLYHEIFFRGPRSALQFLFQKLCNLQHLPLRWLNINNTSALYVLVCIMFMPRKIVYQCTYPIFRLLFGTLYPAYASFKAIRSKNVRHYVKWMMYWIVFAFFTCLETLTDIFLSWLPGYYCLKGAALIWLLSPTTKGSSTMYRKYLHPVLLQREQQIDNFIDRTKERGFSTVIQLCKTCVNVAADVIIQTVYKLLPPRMATAFAALLHSFSSSVEAVNDNGQAEPTAANERLAKMKSTIEELDRAMLESLLPRASAARKEIDDSATDSCNEDLESTWSTVTQVAKVLKKSHSRRLSRPNKVKTH